MANNTCCAWKVTTNDGQKDASTTEQEYTLSQGLQGGYVPYKCRECSNKVEGVLQSNHAPQHEWAGYPQYL